MGEQWTTREKTEHSLRSSETRGFGGRGYHQAFQVNEAISHWRTAGQIHYRGIGIQKKPGMDDGILQCEETN